MIVVTLTRPLVTTESRGALPGEAPGWLLAPWNEASLADMRRAGSSSSGGRTDSGKAIPAARWSWSRTAWAVVALGGLVMAAAKASSASSTPLRSSIHATLRPRPRVMAT